ncbi:hypothetical protein Goari_019502, partial [Gossypium aridum]|nr:hypothetical protein [Gossypium aridum]
MEDELANLRLVDDEEEAIQEDVVVVESFSQFCLVGRCLTDSVVHFPSLRNTMANLWHPIGGICITDIGENRYLFQFFHKVDIARVLAGTPWFFNNHLLILKRILYGDNLTVMELNFTEFWVQVHELPPGLMSESMAMQLAVVRRRVTETSKWLRATDDGSVTIGLGKRPMDLVLEEENDPIAIVEGKKRQRVVEGLIDYLGPKVGSGSMDLSASSGEQSSR